MTMPGFLNLADLIDPTDSEGRSYRQINAGKTHKIPMGALVELVADSEYPGPMDGARLFVVYRGRDCDQTPLYWLCGDPSKTDNDDFYTRCAWHGGYPEESIELIRLRQP
jgi:hypothetical protein